MIVVIVNDPGICLPSLNMFEFNDVSSKLQCFVWGVPATRRCGIAERHAFHPADELYELSPAPDKGKGGRGQKNWRNSITIGLRSKDTLS